MSVDADGPFLTDRVCSNTTLCKLGVPSKEFSISKGFGDFKGGKIKQKVESKSMAKNEHLRSVFDWIQIQFDKTEFSPREIIEDILFLDYDLFLSLIHISSLNICFTFVWASSKLPSIAIT